MSNKIILKKSAVASKVPTISDLDYGELALNYADGKLYYKNSNNAIDEFISSSASVAGVSSVGGATGAISAQQLLDFIKQVDGSGSGLDADTLDGINSSSFATLDGTQTLTNKTLTTPNIYNPTFTQNGGDEGGEVKFAPAATNTTLSTGVTLDVWQDRVRLFETGGTNRGVYINLAGASASVGSELSTNNNTQTLTNKTLSNAVISGTLSAGGAVGTAGQVLQSTGTGVQWSSVAAGGVTSVNGQTGNITASQLLDAIKTVDGTGSGLDADTLDGINSSSFVTLDGTQTLTNKTISASSIDNTPIGATTPSTGVFTTLTANSTLQAGRGSENYVQVTGAATGAIPTISSQGSDVNINLALTAKGTGAVRITNVGSASAPSFAFGSTNRGFYYDTPTGEISVSGGGWTQFRFGNTSSSVNYLSVKGAASATSPVLSSQGTDANIDLTLTPKGTGKVRFGTYIELGSPTFNIDGYIEIKDSIGTVRKLAVASSNTASQAANTILAAPNGSAGAPTFRALVAADIPTLNQNTTGTASNVTGTVDVANGGTGATTAAGARTNLGATTLGSNIFTIVNPSAITFPRFNADNTVSSLSAADFRAAIGAGTSTATGTVTSVGLSLPSIFTVTNSPVTTSGTLTATLATQTANTFLAAPNGSSGAPTFRAIVAGDIPTLNQNTTGNASTATTLQTARTINGVYFDGSANIIVADDTKLPLAGGTMSGAIDMGSNKITGLGAPIASTDAATKQYVDEVAEGLRAKPAVRAATTTNLSAIYDNGTLGVGATLTADTNRVFTTLDGVVNWSVGQGVLVKNQTNAAHNGRYNLTQLGSASTPWVLTRCGLCDEASEIPGSYTFVQYGNSYAGTGWVQIVSDPDTFIVGTNAIIVSQFSGAGSYTAGTGLSLNGNQFSNTGVLSVNSLTGDITATNLLDAIKTVDGSGSGLDAELLDGQTSSHYLDYTNLTNKPTLFSGDYADLTGLPTLFSGDYADLTGLPTLFSGSYNDLTDKPTIPTNVSEFTNDANYTTETFVNNAISTKQDILVSGANIVTVNGQSLLGSGDIIISGGGGGGATYSISAETQPSSAGVELTLTGSDASVDAVSFVGSNGIKVEKLTSDVINITTEFPTNIVAGTGISAETLGNTITISSQSPTTTAFIDLPSAGILTAIDIFDKTVYRTVKYLIQAVNGSDVHCTEVLLTHNNTDVFITEYATMYSGSPLITITDAEINGDTVYIRATATNNDTEIDFVRTTVSRVSAAPPSGDLEGDLMLQSGTEDLMTGTGTVDLDV
jgi:hypothetical protein